MSFFTNAQGFEIHGGQFTSTTTTAITINNDASGPTGIDILREASTPEAAHDSSARAYPPRCFPGTREQYIEDIVHWAVPAFGDPPTPIYWMRGPAGVGKTAVAQTCVERLQKMGVLGAAFFFSINGQDKPEKFFPSIAYQLSTIHPAYHDLIDKKIRRDKTLVNKAMSFQFQYLIDEPLRELEENGKGIRKSVQVFVDGLDECEGADAQCEIIRIVATAASDGVLPLRWAFFSRPESHIEAVFSNHSIAPRCSKAILPISRDADGEIELYLMNGFNNILQRRNISMQSQWPPIEDMKTVVNAAGGSFIYATTVLRFVGHPDSPGPQKRLHAIISLILDRRRRNSHIDASADSPFAELDAFYTLILQHIPPKTFLSVHLLLALLCRGGLSVIMAANILTLSKDEFENVCSHSSAVVYLEGPGMDLKFDPAVDTSRPYTQTSTYAFAKLFEQGVGYLGGRVSFYHKSFEDFLLDPTRSGGYCAKGSEALARHLVGVHLEYDRSFCWRGSELVLAPGVPDSASSLSYPYKNELINSIIKAWVYYEAGSEDSEIYSVAGEAGKLHAKRDFRKHLHTLTQSWRLTTPDPNHITYHLIWGCECRFKSFPGTSIAWVSRSEFAKFNLTEFKLMIKQRQRANIIQRYYPNLASRIKSLLRDEPRERIDSGLYRMGSGEKSIFWYWEIDHNLQHYREFRTTDFAEGEKLYQAENFDLWSRYE